MDKLEKEKQKTKKLTDFYACSLVRFPCDLFWVHV